MPNQENQFYQIVRVKPIYIYIYVPGLNLAPLLRIPEKASCLTICLEEPNRLVLRARQVVTLLHHPPP